ncbi:hypothetical protein O6H91_04G036800 [Diphasiastrum complanatum]|uniref:Uncharacterized protein n=2 Tax=Diphasiastrum complanatum TaxID=34168 RepID=A0ACC2DW58_DIPCM|nr:hypothetical protein O6H91_04G036800 [Diphasiastrum complanatum]KAJ7558383.1 hypothetical protein O6H91_04G036800 [Diphasiastrum complanatum]
MAWKEAYLDIILIPMGMGLLIVYHVFLYYKVRTSPLQTVMGFHHLGRRAWVHAIMKDNDKKNVLAVQTLRNSIMAATLMASTATILSTGLAAVISSTYNIKKPVRDYAYGAHDGFSVSTKFVSLLICFLFSFICYMQSIRFFNHVNYLINIPLDDSPMGITPDYVAHVLARGCNFYTVGARGFYFAFPLLVWIFGPIPVVFCSFALVPVLYRLDMVHDPSDLEKCAADQRYEGRSPTEKDPQLSA